MASLEHRGPGKWRVTISNGYAPDGTKRFLKRTILVDPTKTLLAQRREAEKQAVLIEADYERKLLTDTRKTRLSEVAEEYLESKPLSDSTKMWYRRLLDGRILPNLGKIYVQDLTPRHIREFFKKLTQEAAKPSCNKKKKMQINPTGKNAKITKPIRSKMSRKNTDPDPKQENFPEPIAFIITVFFPLSSLLLFDLDISR